MNLRLRQLKGWSLLAVVVLLGGLWLVRLDYAKKISTNVLDLIPADEQVPELTLVRSLASQAESRTMLFEATQADGGTVPPDASALFARNLGTEPAFDQVMLMGGTDARDTLGHELFAQRFTLLFPLWLRERKEVYVGTGGATSGFSEWLARDSADALNRFLASPEALVFQEVIPADPLLLMPAVADRLKSGLSLVQPERSNQSTSSLLWARLSASPLSEEGQGPAFAAIERCVILVRAKYPGFTVAYTGVNRFAAASRARIEQELTWLNILSVAAVLVVALAFIRDAYRGLHLIPVIVLSVL